MPPVENVRVQWPLEGIRVPRLEAQSRLNILEALHKIKAHQKLNLVAFTHGSDELWNRLFASVKGWSVSQS